MAMGVFLVNVVIISLSGVMTPGAVTAATMAQGTRNRWAGTLISLGHGIVEIPLIFMLMLGLDLVFKMNPVKILIGILGAGFLLWLGFDMLRQSPPDAATSQETFNRNSITTGIVLSATNPYFLFWWATVGLNLAIGAKDLGIMALILFAVVHWSCDLIWLSILSIAAHVTHRGAGLFGPKIQHGILLLCGIALLIFGVKFMYDALKLWFF
jgi:threonine/homoserine/homoserine lactone efflux protein